MFSTFRTRIERRREKKILDGNKTITFSALMETKQEKQLNFPRATVFP
jgi:hypothetical protein